MHYDGSNSFFFVNATKVYQFKAKNSGIKDYSLCLSNIQKILQLLIWKKTGLKGVVNFFSVDFNSIDTNDILGNHKYLMKITWSKTMFRLIKKIFIELTGLVTGSNHTKCISLSNLWLSLLINLHPNEYSQ